MQTVIFLKEAIMGHRTIVTGNPIEEVDLGDSGKVIKIQTMWGDILLRDDIIAGIGYATAEISDGSLEALFL